MARSSFARTVRFLLGGTVLALLGLGVVVWSGVIDVAATGSSPILDRLFNYASMRSIKHHAPREKNPLANDAAALKHGLVHYRAMCVQCHGGPGNKPAEFAKGLHPPAPDLAAPAVQSSFTDGMFYEAIARGIGSTGMPAFAKTHSREELWSIVAFVRHLPTLSSDEKRELGESAPEQAEPPTGASSSVSQKVHQVSITNFKFAPEKLTIHAGDTVVWKNADFVIHSATAEDQTFDTGKLEAGESKRVVMSKKGSFKYVCRYHPAMHGVVEVQ